MANEQWVPRQKAHLTNVAWHLNDLVSCLLLLFLFELLLAGHDISRSSLVNAGLESCRRVGLHRLDG